jgi:hypothetical protein
LYFNYINFQMCSGAQKRSSTAMMSTISINLALMMETLDAFVEGKDYNNLPYTGSASLEKMRF